MCLIIQRPKNINLDYNDFATAVENNPDGYGISAATGDGKLLTIRNHTKPDPEKLFKFIQEELIDFNILVHLRFTTVGETTMRNAHPFPILEKATDGIDLRMAHNGTISSYRGSNWESDSRKFAKEFVRPLFKRFIRGMDSTEILGDKFVADILSSKIPTASVLSFIDGNGNTLNVNETGNGGGYEGKVYLSNKYSMKKGYRDKTPVVYDYDYGVNYYKGSSYQGPKGTTNNNNKGTSIARTHAEDTMTKRFSDKYELKNFNEVLTLTDPLIEELVKENPEDAVLLIKELLEEYQDALIDLEAANETRH